MAPRIISTSGVSNLSSNRNTTDLSKLRYHEICKGENTFSPHFRGVGTTVLSVVRFFEGTWVRQVLNSSVLLVGTWILRAGIIYNGTSVRSK